MKSTVYVHIGTPKTGTTAIQLFLKKNMKDLEKKGVKYPYFEQKFKGVRLQRNGHFLSDNVKNREYIENCFNTVYEAGENFQKIILTDEELFNFGGYSKEFWSDLKERFSARDMDVKMVVYLRRQDTYIASHWAQKVKGVKQKTFTFKEFLDTVTYERNHLDYYRYLSTAADVIGKENIIIRPYEFSQFKGKDHTIVSDFLEALDIEYDDTLHFNNVRRNLSVEGNVLEVKRYLNMIPAFTKKNERFHIYLEKAQIQLREEGKYRNCSTFLKGERKAFLRQFAKGNEAIAREYLHRDDGILFTDAIPDDDPQKMDYTYDEIVMILDMIQKDVEADPNSLFTNEEFASITASAKAIIREKMAPKETKSPEKASLLQKIKKKLIK